VSSSPARYGSFDALRVLEFDLKPRVEDQALELGDALGLKSLEIGLGPRPLQVYQRNRGRLPKPSKSSGSSPVAFVAVSPKAGSTEGAAVVAFAAVGYDAAPLVVPVVRRNHFFSLRF
jgi:hypothetical protein